jgi:hypothetical protein
VRATAWTLRFKHGKQTVLLFAEPLTPFATIKKELIEVLHERYPAGLPVTDSKPEKIPDNIKEVALGVLIDVYETDKGWNEIATDDSGIKESPRSLGLKDGAAIAFAFTDGEEDNVEFKVEWSSYEEQYPEDEAI